MQGIDHVGVVCDGMLEGMGILYTGDYDMKHPLISPVYDDFNGFPPTYLVTSTRDRYERTAKCAWLVLIPTSMSMKGYRTLLTALSLNRRSHNMSMETRDGAVRNSLTVKAVSLLSLRQL